MTSATFGWRSSSFSPPFRWPWSVRTGMGRPARAERCVDAVAWIAMSQDRPSRSGGSSTRGSGTGSGSRSGSSKSKGSGGSGKSGGKKPGGTSGGQRGSYGSGTSKPGSGGRSSGGGSSRGGGSRSPDRRDRPPPRTEAERRAEQVRKTRGPRRTERTPEREREQIESRETEQWIDEGSVRDAAVAATRRGGSARRERPGPEVDPEVVAEIHAAIDPRRAARLSERLASASAALDRERFDEARRMVAPLVRELPQVAAVHEINGLAAYRTGRWKHAAQSLELARQLKPDPALLPVLADCYRAQKRWDDVDTVWNDVKAASPPHDVMAEARIVAAGAAADRGDIGRAIEIMQPAQQAPKRVRAHHLRQWYVLADLFDRAGDTMSATRWFQQIAAQEPQYADVRDRLRALGR